MLVGIYQKRGKIDVSHKAGFRARRFFYVFAHGVVNGDFCSVSRLREKSGDFGSLQQHRRRNVAVFGNNCHVSRVYRLRVHPYVFGFGYAESYLFVLSVVFAYVYGKAFYFV